MANHNWHQLIGPVDGPDNDHFDFENSNASGGPLIRGPISSPELIAVDWMQGMRGQISITPESKDPLRPGYFTSGRYIDGMTFEIVSIYLINGIRYDTVDIEIFQEYDDHRKEFTKQRIDNVKMRDLKLPSFLPGDTVLADFSNAFNPTPLELQLDKSSFTVVKADQEFVELSPTWGAIGYRFSNSNVHVVLSSHYVIPTHSLKMSNSTKAALNLN
jgi:hypothetical protein